MFLTDYKPQKREPRQTRRCRRQSKKQQRKNCAWLKNSSKSKRAIPYPKKPLTKGLMGHISSSPFFPTKGQLSLTLPYPRPLLIPLPFRGLTPKGVKAEGWIGREVIRQRKTSTFCPSSFAPTPTPPARGRCLSRV